MTAHHHSAERPSGEAQRPPSHGHGHGHTPDVDFGEHVALLAAGAAIRAGVTERIAADLPVVAGGVALDVGSGVGDMTTLLAGLVGDGGRVHALDVSGELLAVVRERAAAHGVADRVRTAPAGFDDLPGALPEPADVVWAGAVVHHYGDQVDALRRLVACVRPGGHVVIAEGGVAARSLPWDVGVGDPGLEQRLFSVHERWFRAMRASLPGSTRAPHGWPALLRQAGLVDVAERAYLLHRPAPLSDSERLHVVDGLARRVERAAEWLDDADRAAWARLLDDGDDAWLGHRDDLSILGVDTTHTGRRPV